MNEKITITIKSLLKIITLFIDIFVSAYFIQTTEGSIKELLIYRMTFFCIVILSFFATAKIAKSQKRMYLVWLGLFLKTVFLLLVMYFKEAAAEHYVFLGIVFGLSEGTFWSAFNVISAEGIKQEHRRQLNGLYKVITGVIGILFPIVTGKLLDEKGFSFGLVAVVIISVILFVVSLFYKDTGVNSSSEYSMGDFVKKAKEIKLVKKYFLMSFMAGLTHNDGALTIMTTIVAAKIAVDSSQLGNIAAIKSGIPILTGLIMMAVLNNAKKLNISHYISTFLLAISIIMLVFRFDIFSVIMINLCYGIYRGFISEETDIAVGYITNNITECSKYKTELFIIQDLSLFVGRIISHSILLVYAFTGSIYLMLFFILPLVCLSKILGLLLNATEYKYQEKECVK